jgi:hypothetical protein
MSHFSPVPAGLSYREAIELLKKPGVDGLDEGR